MPKRTFQPNIRRRKRVHGFLKKMRTYGGKRILSLRRGKGRYSLTPQILKYLFPDKERLRSASLFKNVYEQGDRYKSRFITFCVLKAGEGERKTGFAASGKKISVFIKHKIKRRLKEAYRLNMNKLKHGFYLVIIGREGVVKLKFREIENIFMDLSERAKLKAGSLSQHMVKIIVFVIKLYRVFISPFSPASCRFEPSCSSYSIEAFKKYGVIKGFFLTAKRILRCNPFSKAGYDPLC